MNRADKFRITHQVLREIAPKIHELGMAFLGVLERHEARKVAEEVSKSTELRPQVATNNEGIRDVFMVGQQVRVRRGTSWVTRKILGITVLRTKVVCPYCDAPMLGEARFWFSDYGNILIEDVMAEEDFDPKHQETHRHTSL